jgi:dihydrofolate reductase
LDIALRAVVATSRTGAPRSRPLLNRNGDVEAAIRELKAKPGRELQVHGSGVLLRWLLERDLVDELDLRITPVIVGDGLRLFPEHAQTHDLELVESRSTSRGVMIQTYRPNGRATFATVGE